MSYLVVDSFDASFTTVDTTARFTENAMIHSIRLKMFKHGTIADGTVTLTLLDGATSIGNVSITAAEFNSGITGTYAHGYVKFTFPESVCVNLESGSAYSEITIRIAMSGHTPDASNYLGLVKQHENTFVSEHGTRPDTISTAVDCWYNPYGIEIYGIKR